MGAPLRHVAKVTPKPIENLLGQQACKSISAETTRKSELGDPGGILVCDLMQPALSQSVFEPEM